MRKVRITALDKRMFSEGACHLLAQEISRATGWALCAFTYDDDHTEPDIHAFVKTPRGTYLDVFGEHDEGELLKRWESWRVQSEDIQHFPDWSVFGSEWTEGADEIWPRWPERIYKVASALIERYYRESRG